MTVHPSSSNGRRRRVAALVATTAVAAGVLIPASNAAAVTTVTAGNGAEWEIHDAERPALDTGSIRAVSQSRIDGFGNIFVRIDTDAEPRYNGEMMRGFGLQLSGSEYTSTRAVDLGGVHITRTISIDAMSSSARYFDSFTNTTDDAVTVDVSFGGALGYGSTTNQSPIRATSDGDAVITPADAWTVAATQQGSHRPVGVVLGSPAPFAGALTGTGNQERNPFETPLATTGHEANFYGYINTLTVQPGETASLARFVHVGSTGAGSLEYAEAAVAELASAPDFTGLGHDELCSLTNWDLAAVGVDASTCGDGVRLEMPAPEPAAPLTTIAEYDVFAKTITQLQSDLEAGETTSVEITQAYLDRIAAYDDGAFGLKSYLHVAADALDQARAADEARAAGATGDLLGIPIGVKDIYDTEDMPTTGGSRALDGWQPGSDAYQVEKLREAGAVIIGKTNTSEFANSGSYSESGWQQTWNALYPSKTSFGSSGGSAVAVAASLAAGAMGTQTGVSLYAPTTGSSLTTFRGTDGMASTRGVMPLTWGQDYAGPIARSVTDLAVLLNATTGTDPLDILTAEADAHRPADWTTALSAEALEGKTIGYLPASFQSSYADDGTGEAARAQLTELEAAGATVIEMPSAPSGGRSPGGSRNEEGWARYIELHDAFPYPDGDALLASPEVLPYNQRSLRDTPRMTSEEVDAYIAYRTQYKEIIGDWMAENGVDAVVYPGFISDMYNNDGSSSQHSSDRGTGVLTSSVGLPTVVVPVGVNPHGYSMSLQLVGPAWSDADVLAMGYALEQRTQAQLLPSIVPPLEYVGDPDPEPGPGPGGPGTGPNPDPGTGPDAGEQPAGEVTPPTAERPGALPVTGAEPGPLPLLAVGMLLVGVMLLVAHRMRRGRRS